MRNCAAQADDAVRLACYDNQFKQGGHPDARQDLSPAARSAPLAAPASSGAVSVPSTAPAAGTSTPPVRMSATDQFGLTAGQILSKGVSAGQQPAPLKHLRERIADVSERGEGYLVLRLNNGQVWEQTEAGPDLRIGTGDAIQIDRGVLGAYWLSKPSGHAAIKVRRIS